MDTVLNDELATQDIAQLHQLSGLVNAIKASQSSYELIRLTKKRHQIYQSLLRLGAHPHIIGQVLSQIYDAFNWRWIELAETALGEAPCAYAWMLAGSHAREEIHLLSDQDSALILDNSATEADKAYFAHLAMYVCKGLAQSGYALCSGHFMAATPKWCQTLEVWQTYYKKWASHPEYDFLLQLTVFLDTRLLVGDAQLFHQLEDTRRESTLHNERLIFALIQNMLKTRPPINVFKHLQVEKNAQDRKVLNIKKAGITSIVDMARIYMLSQGGDRLSTQQRLQFAFSSAQINRQSYDDFKAIFEYLNRLRDMNHGALLARREPLSNQVEVENLASFDYANLTQACQIIYGMQDAMKMKFGI